MIGELIARRRKYLGLSQTELGSRTNTSQRQVSRLENGEDGVIPRRDTLERFGAALGITLAEFYQAAGLMEPPVEEQDQPRPLPAIDDVVEYIKRDPEIVSKMAGIKATVSPATYDRLVRQLAEAWRSNGRMMLATWETALASAKDDDDATT